MEKSIKTLKNSEKAITLIALVITIIVLLILAGISISMLSGDNGILQKATTAKQNTDNSQIQEQINLAYHASLVEGQGKITEPSLESELKKEFNKDTLDEGWLDKTSVEGKWKITIDKVSLEVPAGIEASDNKITIKVGTTNLKDVSNLSTLYGETTDYISVDEVNWQLFYDDNDYIYLIASEYVPVDTLPNELKKYPEGDTPKVAGFYEYTETDPETHTYAYTGTIVETGEWSKGTSSNTFTANTVISYITTNYLKWVNSNVGNTTNNLNMKAVAYMMDTSKWNNFAGDVKGAYAIGGPTLEMFVLSYNAKHSENQLGTYETIIDASSNSTNGNANSSGYKVKVGSGSWTDIGEGLDTGNMWILSYNSDTYGYWLSSPSAIAPEQVITVMEYRNGGTILGNGYNRYGFRPLVAIPKACLK